MIGSVRDKITAALIASVIPKGFPPNVANQASRKLALLDAATGLNDLRVPSGNRLEALSGSRKGQHSIRVNDQRRICFLWSDENSHRVEVTAYHWAEVCVTIQRSDLHRVDFSDIDSGVRLAPVTPGKVLREEFMEPMDLSARALARAIDVPPNRITEILGGKRSVTAKTAILLGRHFGNSPRFWMNLQVVYDLAIAENGMAA